MRVPSAIVAKLNSAVQHAVATPQGQAKLKSAGVDPTTTSPEEFGRIIANDVGKSAKLVKTSGVAAE
jgi:tripartite-type tricarboxylate transporter receptor subunit TctC